MIRGFLALAMFATVSLLAAVIENAVRGVAQAEAQMAADAGALAGAGWLLIQPAGEPTAKAKAAEHANLNRVGYRTGQVLPEDVVVNLDSGTVRVEVHARAYGVPPVLAWILGVDEVRVTAVATAETRGGPSDPPMGRVEQHRIPKTHIKLIE